MWGWGLTHEKSRMSHHYLYATVHGSSASIQSIEGHSGENELVLLDNDDLSAQKRSKPADTNPAGDTQSGGI